MYGVCGIGFGSQRPNHGPTPVQTAQTGYQYNKRRYMPLVGPSNSKLEESHDVQYRLHLLQYLTKASATRRPNRSGDCVAAFTGSCIVIQRVPQTMLATPS